MIQELGNKNSSVINDKQFNNKMNGFHSGYLIFGATCENCINNQTGYTLRRRIKCGDPKECPVFASHQQK